MEITLVSPAAEAVLQRPDGCLEIQKPGATVRITATGGPLQSASSDRVFNFVPGMEALPLRLALSKSAEAKLSITVKSR